MTRVGDRFTLGARLGVRAADGDWSVGVFCRNCFDKRYPSLIATDPFSGSNGGLAVSYVHNFTVDSYRLIGITLDGRF
jgi:iron complex outermembrane receptor protein